MCWLCDMLHESERLERVSKAHSVSVVAQVEVVNTCALKSPQTTTGQL